MRRSKLTTRLLFALLSTAFALTTLHVVAQAATVSTPVIALTDVPAYGEKRPIQGQVFMEDGSAFSPSDYRISLFLQLDEGQTYWPKPTSDTPYVDVGVDGSFSGVFITGGTDYNAKILHVLLIPSTYTPTTFANTQAQAVDYVRIDRTEDGGVTVSPQRQAPEALDAAPAIFALLPVQQNKIAVDVGFYTNGSSPGSALSEELIRQQLNAVSRISDTVRFYSASGEVNKAYAIAHGMGFQIVGTANLTGDASNDKTELDALIALCNAGLVQVACVGNETLLKTNDITPKLTANELVAHIQYVRNALTDETIPVTTSDSVDVLLANSSVRNACNLIMPNCYPFWGGTDISDAAEAFTQSITALQAVSGGKQVLVSETGWPTAGGTLGSSVAGEEQAAAYFEAVRAWSLQTNTQVLYFQAADEPWKTEAGYGPHWGFMTSGFALKDAFAQTSFFKGLGIGAGCVHDVVVDAAVPATCTTDGLTEGAHCTICGDVLTAQATVPATGHAWGAWTTVRAATEQEPGEEKRVCKNDPAHTETRAIPRLAAPVLALTHAPAYGEANPFEGVVFREDGEGFKAANYAVTLYLEEPNTHSYWVKPSADQPFVTLGKGGTFSLPYTILNADARRTDLWLLLLSASAAKNLSAHIYPAAFSALCDSALDCVHVQRSENGSVVVSPQRRIPLTIATVSGITNKTYTGSALKPAPVVKIGARKLVSGTDYKVSYANNVNPGTATVTITGKGTYKGTVKKTFKIAKAAQAIAVKASVSSVAVGKTTTIAVSGNKGAVSFASSNTAVASVSKAGKVTAKKVGTVTITANAAATTTHAAASASVTIKVVPAGTSIKSVTSAATGSMTVAWAKDATGGGYTVQYSTNKSFASANKTATISKAATTSQKITGLAKGKTYYVRIRSLKVVSGKTYYSAWSAAKSVKV